MSTTRTVSIREFRTHMSKFLNEAQKKGVHFVVMKHSEPIARITPVEKDASLESLIAQVARARRDIAEGNVYTPEEVLAMIKKNETRLHSGRRKRHSKTPA